MIERCWSHDVDPFPAESSLRASCVLLLAGSVSRIFLASVPPDIAVASVIERNWFLLNHFRVELPGESSSSAEVVHVLATTVGSVLSADFGVACADWFVVDWSDHVNYKLPGEALSAADSVPFLAPSVAFSVSADS